MVRYFDAHSHIHGKEYDSDRAEVLLRMKEAGVGTITVGTYLESSQKAVQLAESEPLVWASVGLHPTDTKNEFDRDAFEELARHERVVAIGECGLDYFRLAPTSDSESGRVRPEEDSREEKERQKKIFLEQVELSLAVNKPLMIHCRPSGKSMDAHEDMLSILESRSDNVLRGNIHFFTGTLEVAKRYIDLGFSLSFPGVVTFTHEYDDLVRNLPLDWIISETDAPYASPVPFRGKRNEPVYVVETVKHLASLRGDTEEVLSKAILKNVENVFGIKTTP